MKLFVIAGHNYNSPGALAYNGRYEHHYNLDLQRRVFTLNPEGIITDCEWKNLGRLINWINQTAKRGDRLVDIHFNFNHPTATGTEVFIHPYTNQRNKNSATFMVRSASEILDIPIRRANNRRDYKYPSESAIGSLGIIERTRIPAILFEPCFLNQHDMEKYMGKEDLIARAIYQSYE